jgi:hypothetical protein
VSIGKLINNPNGFHMTSRERVIAAINHKAADRTPMDFGGTLMSVCLPEFLEDMRNKLGYMLPDDHDADGSWVDEDDYTPPDYVIFDDMENHIDWGDGD